MVKDIFVALKEVPTFKEVPDAQLKWLQSEMELVTLNKGETLFEKGSPITHLLVVLEGKFVIKMQQKGQYRVIGAFQKGSVTGSLPFSRAESAAAMAEAVEDATVLKLPKDRFKKMIHNFDELTTALVHTMTTRVRDFTRLQQQNDKMLALGKLSAGLAHELNNPSAAVVRTASELKKHLGLLPGGFKRVIKIKLEDEQVDKVNEMLFSKLEEGSCKTMTLMDKAALEDEITDWLEDYGMTDPYDMAETFADYDLNVDDLEMVAEVVREEDLPPVINWLSQVLTTEKLVNEIEEASQRINKLVNSIKSYAHMDKSPDKQPADIHEGIRNTLTMLNHKLKRGNIKVVESFDAELPQPQVFVSELNQVWTNLIDNAIDAMEENGGDMLEIKTQPDGEFVKVHIVDNGPGIPEDIKDQIFDPFFTTKTVGKGTGLGLDVVQKIILQHNGSVTVESAPGRTVFEVCIPIK